MPRSVRGTFPTRGSCCCTGNSVRMRHRIGGCLLLFVLILAGCSREYYARDADRETYSALSERNRPPWFVPNINITPPPESRIYVPGNEVDPPSPPDDPPAHEYMLYANGIPGSVLWKHAEVA